MDKLLATLDKVKTPLILGGLAVIVFYELYSQVLQLKIFPQLPADSAFVILREVLQYVFWLAIVAVVLGAVSYVVVRLTPAQHDPDEPVKLKVTKVKRK